MIRQNKIGLIIIGFIASLIGACSTPHFETASFGLPLAKDDFEKVIRQRLIDPYSAHVKCSEPRKAFNGQIYTSGSGYGYASTCSVNAKNTFGGYTGEKTAIYFWRSDNTMTNPSSVTYYYGSDERTEHGIEVSRERFDPYRKERAPDGTFYYIVEEGGYCRITKDCTAGLACISGRCIKPK